MDQVLVRVELEGLVALESAEVELALAPVLVQVELESVQVELGSVQVELESAEVESALESVLV